MVKSRDVPSKSVSIGNFFGIGIDKIWPILTASSNIPSLFIGNLKMLYYNTLIIAIMTKYSTLMKVFKLVSYAV